MASMPPTISKNDNPTSVDDVLREFREVYADAVTDWNSPEEWEALAQRRRLTWTAPRRIAHKDAARCYGQIGEGYNAFKPHMIDHLSSRFSSDKIEVTSAREYSVAVYLHVPDDRGLRSRVEAFVREHLDADVVAWVDDGTLRIWWD